MQDAINSLFSSARHFHSYGGGGIADAVFTAFGIAAIGHAGDFFYSICNRKNYGQQKEYGNDKQNFHALITTNIRNGVKKTGLV